MLMRHVHGVWRIRTRLCEGRGPGSTPGLDTVSIAAEVATQLNNLVRRGRNRWPASVRDSTTDFESVRPGSTPGRAT